MTVDRVLDALCRELRVLRIPADDRDVSPTAGGDLILSLAPGLIVWVGTEWYRWIGDGVRWRWHTVRDPAGAARLINRVYGRRGNEPAGGNDAVPR
ncbi:hypothetical protein [Streptosporangium sp. NPDC006007]|uniref:hypothetical protein n=1 Tax=Streptosporangium sp. NPDC006007 TaxID=3154575 RepID=UPI0033A1B586